MIDQPIVTYFVESREQAEKAMQEGKADSRGDFLQENIGSPEVVSALQYMGSRLAIALNRDELRNDSRLLDLLRGYNAAGIDVDLWANLPDKDGYWIHAGNVEPARRQVFEMVNDLEREGIKVKRVGLDLEMPGQLVIPDFRLSQYLRTAPWKFSQRDAEDKLGRFIEELFWGGHAVDTYELPILGDYRLFRRLMGIPKAPVLDLPGYRRVGLTYTSVLPPVISSNEFIEKYSAGFGRTPAIGIVSSSDENPGRNIEFGGLLNDEALEADVRAALSVSPGEFHVFALNGMPVIRRVRAAIEKTLTG